MIYSFMFQTVETTLLHVLMAATVLEKVTGAMGCLTVWTGVMKPRTAVSTAQSEMAYQCRNCELITSSYITLANTAACKYFSGCLPGQFLCDGYCHPDYERCDYTQHCFDRDDERDCGKPPII